MGSIRGRFGYNQASQEAGLGHQISFVLNVVGKASARISNPTLKAILSGPFQYISFFIQELISTKTKPKSRRICYVLVGFFEGAPGAYQQGRKSSIFIENIVFFFDFWI